MDISENNTSGSIPQSGTTRMHCSVGCDQSEPTVGFSAYKRRVFDSYLVNSLFGVVFRSCM